MPATVLIVDDHPTFRKFARRLLEQSGFVIVGEAASGAAAIDAVRELRPSVVVLDVLLPDISGLDVAAELANSRHPPAVVLTSSRSPGDLGVALVDAPARGFIPKASFTSAALAELVA